MSSNDKKKKANDPPEVATPAPNPATQPHGTTQDQVKEMESEGQAAKPGQIPSPSAPDAQKPGQKDGSQNRRDARR